MGNFVSYELLPIVFNMSVTASVVIVFVLLARLLLKKAPKIFSYALWAVVLFRLLCPVSITTDFSLLGLFDAPVTETTTHTTAVEYIPQDVVHTPAPEVNLPVPGVNQSVNEALPQGDEQTAADPLEAPVALATLVWIAGIGVLAVYSVVSLLRLRRKLIGALPLRDNIYLADYIDSPFVMGIFRPKIYLPSSLTEQEQGYIILHEQHHIRRGDHIIKALAFLVLCIHWFNPLVWVAFVLSAKDMEMSCDEAVVRKLGEGIRADYSASLLSLATGRRIIAGTPLAFGEGDTKSRIRNLLNWKKPRTWIILTALVVCLVAIVFCAANPQKDSVEDNNMIAWEVDAEYPEAVVDIVNDYVMQQVEHYNDLGSGEMALGGEYTILEAKVIGLTSMEPAPYDETHNVGLYLLEYRLLPSEPSHVVIAGGMQMDGDWITEWGSTGQPYLALMFEDNGPEDVWTLVGVTNTDSIQFDYSTEEMVTRYGSKYIAAAMELCNAYLNAQTQNQYATAADASYYLELSAIGKEFRDMGLENKIRLLEEYEDLLDDYALVARESTDGKSAYIVGSYKGNIEDSPLYMMVSTDGRAEVDDWCQILYRKADSTAVEEALAAQRTPSTGYRIEGSWISFSDQNGIILIQPRDTELSLDVALRSYLYTPNGRDYIKDAASRGVDMCSRTEPFLYVYRISESYGEIAERFSLTEAEASTILTEKRQTLTDGFGFAATLHMDGETVLFSETTGVPQSVLDLAVEKCDYRFADPSLITGPILGAELDCDWLDTTLRADEVNLPRLEEILKDAEFGAVGDCGYGARLTLRLTGGEKMTVFKGTDDCGSLVFGSYGGYFIGDKENSEFWKMFGLNPETKEPLEEQPKEEEQPEVTDIPADPPASSTTSNAPFANQPISWDTPLNGMFERTYETQLSMLKNIDMTDPPFFKEQVLEFDTCTVLLGTSLDTGTGVLTGTAYILFRDGALGKLPLPMNASGLAIQPTTVTDNGDSALSYVVVANGNTCCYTVDLESRTVSMSVGLPAKTFTPADVEFSGRALATQTDTMTYEERLALAQTATVYDGSTDYISLGKYREGEDCLAFLGQWIGTPHVNQYVFNIRFSDGTIAYLPLADMSYPEPALPDSMEFQNGKLVYETTFEDELLMNEGQELIHLKGTYHYEVDLAAKTVSLTVFQQ